MKNYHFLRTTVKQTNLMQAKSLVDAKAAGENDQGTGNSLNLYL